MTSPDPATATPPLVPPDPVPPRVLRLGDLLVGFGGLLVFGFSFAPFIEYTEQAAFLFGLLDVPLWFSAWSLQTFLVPLTTFVVAAALLGIAAVAVRFALRRDPEVLGFRLRQLEVGLALFGSVVLLGMVASDKHAIVGARRLAEVDPTFRLEEVAMSTGWGAALMLAGALIALAGALLNHLGIGLTIAVGGGTIGGGQPAPPPPPGGYHGAPPSYWQTPPPPPAAPPPAAPPPAAPPPSPPRA